MCSSTVQVHIGNRAASDGFVCVHVRKGVPPSLGFPLTLRLHFLLLNSFFPTAPQRKWKLFRRGQVSLSVPTGTYKIFDLFDYLIKGQALQMLQ